MRSEKCHEIVPVNKRVPIYHIQLYGAETPAPATAPLRPPVMTPARALSSTVHHLFFQARTGIDNLVTLYAFKETVAERGILASAFSCFSLI